MLSQIMTANTIAQTAHRSKGGDGAHRAGVKSKGGNKARLRTALEFQNMKHLPQLPQLVVQRQFLGCGLFTFYRHG